VGGGQAARQPGRRQPAGWTRSQGLRQHPVHALRPSALGRGPRSADALDGLAREGGDRAQVVVRRRRVRRGQRVGRRDLDPAVGPDPKPGRIEPAPEAPGRQGADQPDRHPIGLVGGRRQGEPQRQLARGAVPGQALQRRDQLVGRAIASGAALLEAASDHAGQAGRHVGAVGRDRRRRSLRVGELGAHPGVIEVVVGAGPGQQLEQHHAERPQVGAPVEGLAAELLGRHVAQRASDLAAPRRRGAPGGRRLVVERALGVGGDAEVQHLDGVVGADHDVRGLEVAVDDPVGVGAGQRARHRGHDREHPRHRQALAARELRQGLAGDVLEHQIGRVVVLADLMDRDDVRVRAASGHARLGEEALDPRRVDHGHELDRDQAVELAIAGQEDPSHAAAAELPEHEVTADQLADPNFARAGLGLAGIVGRRRPDGGHHGRRGQVLDRGVARRCGPVGGALVRDRAEPRRGAHVGGDLVGWARARHQRIRTGSVPRVTSAAAAPDVSNRLDRFCAWSWTTTGVTRTRYHPRNAPEPP
jgi:hypothetical protein